MKAQQSTEKSISEMTLDDQKVLATVLSWQGKSLIDCSKGELLKCIIHMTAQVAYLNNKIEKYQLPFYKRAYWVNRFYWRGSTALGIFNTLSATLFNRVLIRKVTPGDAGLETVGWTWDLGTNFKKEKVHG